MSAALLPCEEQAQRLREALERTKDEKLGFEAMGGEAETKVAHGVCP